MKTFRLAHSYAEHAGVSPRVTGGTAARIKGEQRTVNEKQEFAPPADEARQNQLAGEDLAGSKGA